MKDEYLKKRLELDERNYKLLQCEKTGKEYFQTSCPPFEKFALSEEQKEKDIELLHILEVISSCENIEQLNHATSWGQRVMKDDYSATVLIGLMSNVAAKSFKKYPRKIYE